jgi:phosphohistidine phosphatase
MKRLILVRHGKSSWKEDLPDDQRPLKARAFKDADLVIKAFKHFSNSSPEIWSSHAVRALTTAKLFKEQLEVSTEHFSIKKDLYTFEQQDLKKALMTCADHIDELMIFGHNPAMTGIANQLGDQHFSNIPTTGLVIIDFEANSWKTIKNGKTIIYLFPKYLR